MIGSCLLAFAQVDAARVTLARVEVTGPCAQFSIELEGGGNVEFGLRPLSAGERRTITVAVPLPPESLPTGVWSRVVAQALAATEHAKLIELKPAVDLAGLHPELLARPRPVLAVQGARLPWSALFVLGAALAITLSRRRSVWIATATALVASALVLFLVRGLGNSEIPAARLLEARFDLAPGEPFLAVEARRENLGLTDLAQTRIEVTPQHRLIACRTEIEPPGYALDSRGATFVQLRAFDPGTRRLSRAVNAFGRFDEAWLREADGEWLSLGPWNLGDPLPTGRPGEPPGWLVPVLPMGTSIFLGRLGEGQILAFDGDGAPSARQRPPTWMRGLGL